MYWLNIHLKAGKLFKIQWWIDSKRIMIWSWNFQGSFLLQKGSFQPNFSKIWDGHHGRSRWPEMKWPYKQLSEQLFIRTSFFAGHLCGCFRTLFSSTRVLFLLFLISRLLFCRVYPRHQVQLPKWLIWTSQIIVRYMGQRLTSYKKVVSFFYRQIKLRYHTHT